MGLNYDPIRGIPDQKAAHLALRLATSQRNVQMAMKQLERALNRADRALDEAWAAEAATLEYLKKKENE